MVECTLAVCAETIIRDAETNSISIINVLEELPGHGFPLLMPKLSCLFMFRRNADDPSELDGQITFKIDDEHIISGPIHVNFQGGLRHRQIVVMRGFVIARPGIVRAAVVFEDRELGAWEIHAHLVDGPQLQIFNDPQPAVAEDPN